LDWIWIRIGRVVSDADLMDTDTSCSIRCQPVTFSPLLIWIRGVDKCIDVGCFIFLYDIFTLYYYIHVINLSYYPKRHSSGLKLANGHVSDWVDYENGVGYHYMEY
jgi:hypothetical protein